MSGGPDGAPDHGRGASHGAAPRSAGDGAEAGNGAEGGRPAAERPAGGPAGSDPGGRPLAPVRPTFTCDLCGHVMLDLHCKLVCERCGYKRDCSDP